MGFFRPKHGTFSYIPKYYRQDSDPERQIKFERKTLFDPHKKAFGLTRLIVFFVLILLLFGYLLPKMSTVEIEKTKISTEDLVNRQ